MNDITSQITKFLMGTGADNKGRKFHDILNWSGNQLEYSHNSIQWLFPLNEPSAHNPDAPVLTRKDIDEIRGNIFIQWNIIAAFCRMMLFYFPPDKKSNEWHWLTPRNHNYLRLTRILKCLGLINRKDLQSDLICLLEVVYKHPGNIIGQETLNFWRDASPPQKRLDILYFQNKLSTSILKSKPKKHEHTKRNHC